MLQPQVIADSESYHRWTCPVHRSTSPIQNFPIIPCAGQQCRVVVVVEGREALADAAEGQRQEVPARRRRRRTGRPPAPCRCPAPCDSMWSSRASTHDDTYRSMAMSAMRSWTSSACAKVASSFSRHEHVRQLQAELADQPARACGRRRAARATCTGTVGVPVVSHGATSFAPTPSAAASRLQKPFTPPSTSSCMPFRYIPGPAAADHGDERLQHVVRPFADGVDAGVAHPPLDRLVARSTPCRRRPGACR